MVQEQQTFTYYRKWVSTLQIRSQMKLALMHFRKYIFYIIITISIIGILTLSIAIPTSITISHTEVFGSVSSLSRPSQGVTVVIKSIYRHF